MHSPEPIGPFRTPPDRPERSDRSGALDRLLNDSPKLSHAWGKFNGLVVFLTIAGLLALQVSRDPVTTLGIVSVLALAFGTALYARIRGRD